MRISGNKDAIYQLLRGCREELNSVKNKDYTALIELYQLVFDVCRGVCIVDEDGLRLLDDHLDDWKSIFEDSPNLRIVVKKVLGMMREALQGRDVANTNQALQDLQDAVGDCEPRMPKLKIEAPDMADLDSCKFYCSRLYWQIREKLVKMIHSETQAVDYILDGCQKGEIYYKECKVARQIRDDRNWKKSTFLTHAKKDIGRPTPKTLKRAAKKQATEKKVRRDISEYSAMRFGRQ